MPEQSSQARGTRRNVGASYAEFLNSMQSLSGCTQADLAEMLETRRATISLWMLGKSRPQRHKRDKIAEAFGLDEGETLQLRGMTIASSPESVVHKTNAQEQILGAFVTRVAQGPPMSESEIVLLRDLIELS